MIRAMVKAMLPRTLVTRTLRRAGRAVLLTFDDGPHAEVTPAVLDRLDEYGARAVFFLIGRRIKRAPHLPAQIRDRGHLLGNHSHLHLDRYVLADERPPGFCEYYRDSQRCQAAIERHAGIRPVLFRPPGGRLTPVTVLVPKLLGLRCVTWSREVSDWRFRSPGEAQAGASALAATVAPGDIVLLHDDNPWVLDVLDALLPELRRRDLDLGSGIRHL